MRTTLRVTAPASLGAAESSAAEGAAQAAVGLGTAPAAAQVSVAIPAAVAARGAALHLSAHIDAIAVGKFKLATTWPGRGLGKGIPGLRAGQEIALGVTARVETCGAELSERVDCHARCSWIGFRQADTTGTPHLRNDHRYCMLMPGVAHFLSWQQQQCRPQDHG